MSTRARAPLTDRTIAFLFRYVFTADQVEVCKVPTGFAAYFNGEAAPRYVASTLSDVWDKALDDKIQLKLNEHSNS